MLALAIIFVIILNLSIFISLLCKEKIDKCFIVSLLSIIVIFYIFGLFKILSFGIYFVYILSVFCFIFNVISIRKDKENKKLIFTKGLFAYISFFLLLCWIHRGRIISNWDEFSHWGDVVKAIFSINDFQTNPLSYSLFKSYPPAMSMFQYFFMQIDGVFHESFLYVAYNLIGFCFLLPIISDEKNTKKYLLLFITIVILPTIIFTNYYSTIYIDAMVGIAFAYGVFLIRSKKNICNCVFLVLDLIVLVLFKDVGLFFAIILLLLLILQLLLEKSFRKYAYMVLVSIGAIVFAKVSWSIMISMNNVSVSFGGKILISDIFKLLTGQYTDYRFQVTNNYINALQNVSIVNSFISLGFIHLLLLYSTIFVLLIKKKILDKRVACIYIASGIIYCIGLLVLYCFRFSEYEAINLASYSRYMSIYFIAITIILFMHILYLKKWYVFLIAVLFFAPFNNLLLLRNNVSVIQSNRLKYEISAANIKDKVKSGEKVYVISQNDNGFDYWNIRFLVRPIAINENFTWSIGSKYNENDIWTKDITSQDFINYLIENNFKYVYIYKCDEKFKNEFTDIFNNVNEIGDNNLYIVDDLEKKLLKL